MYAFKQKQLMASYLRTVTLQQVIGFFSTYIKANSKQRTKFSSQFYGCKTVYPSFPATTSFGKKIEVVRDAATFKKSLPLQAVKSMKQVKM